MKYILFILLINLIGLTGCFQNRPFKTIENLKIGIKGESTACKKYAAFAEKARLDGKNEIAKLFEATSKSESIHAANHEKVLEVLGEKMELFVTKFEVNTTEENLQEAIEGESYEVNTMYPLFMLEAKAEKISKAEKTFTWSYNTEKKHKQFYLNTLSALQNQTEKLLSSAYIVCPLCGNTYEKTTLEEYCAFCQTLKAKFIEF